MKPKNNIRRRATEIQIRGKAKFKSQIAEALALLKIKAPEEYRIVLGYIGIIKHGKRSGMWAYRTPPTFEINDRTAFYSVPWCAGAIAHDSYHSKLYHEYAKDHTKKRVPDKVWVGQAAEKQCLAHQLRVLQKIGASVHEINYCKQPPTRFFAMNYQERNW